MRLRLTISPSDGIVDYNYYTKLVGVLHKWLGNNELHGKLSLYSFSWLKGGISEGNGLIFPQGASMFFSFYDEHYLKQILKAILHDPKIFYGMQVTDVEIQETPDFSNKTLFLCGSPIFIHRQDENKKYIHYTYESALVGDLLKETLLYKMKMAGLPPDETLQVRFDTTYPKKKIKLIDYRGVKNRVNLCPVIIQGKPETKAFAWNVGLGNSTGIGLGSIY